MTKILILGIGGVGGDFGEDVHDAFFAALAFFYA